MKTFLMNPTPMMMKNKQKVYGFLKSLGEIDLSYKKKKIAVYDEETKTTRKVLKRIYYYDITLAFDTETSSFYVDGEKQAIMYVWQLGISGTVIIGRTWGEFLELISMIRQYIMIDNEHRLVIYVHNLAFDFQFFKDLFLWDETFCLKKRVPIDCVTEGIEFRCSYVLSGLSLSNLDKNITKYPVHKLSGDLDYELLRHSNTPLSDKEIGYCVNDVLTDMSYIQEKAENEGGIAKLLLTKTGYVRQFVKDKCFSDKYKRKAYINMMKRLSLEPDEYMALRRAFQGGFTHANKRTVGKTLKNITSTDFVSSYPAVMLSEPFPMSKGRKVEIKNMTEYVKYSSKYLMIFDLSMKNFELKDGINDTPISVSKCFVHDDCYLDNGRILQGNLIKTTITNIDMDIITKAYNYEAIKIENCWIYGKGYLPKDVIESALYFYKGKTTLKGVTSRRIEYALLKEHLNSIYGMMVTNIIMDVIQYKGLWVSEEPSIEDSLYEYNNSNSRFLSYPWGVFITAYARRNLWTGIFALGDDYHYSDTDSLKVSNIDKHLDYFKWYDKQIKAKMLKMCKYHNIDPDELHPKNIKGDEKWIGVWDLTDGFYDEFKTLGAKRYLVREGGEYEMTVAGVTKKAVKYLEKTGNPFDLFEHNLLIPASETGKMTHTYIDEPMQGTITDYLGNIYNYSESSGVHLEKCSFQLKMKQEYQDLIESLVSYEEEIL